MFHPSASPSAPSCLILYLLCLSLSLSPSPWSQRRYGRHTPAGSCAKGDCLTSSLSLSLPLPGHSGAMAGIHLQDLVRTEIAEPLGIAHELFLGLPPGYEKRTDAHTVATLSNGFIVNGAPPVGLRELLTQLRSPAPSGRVTPAHITPRRAERAETDGTGRPSGASVHFACEPGTTTPPVPGGEANGRLPAAERQLPAVDPTTDMTRFAENDAARALVAGSHPIARLPVPQVAPYTGNVDQFVTKGW